MVAQKYLYFVPSKTTEVLTLLITLVDVSYSLFLLIQYFKRFF